MWPWKQKECECKEKIDEIKKELKHLEADFLKLETDQANLRGQFNRKLKGIAEFEARNGPAEEPEPKKQESAKPLNTGGPVVFTGMHLGDIPK